MTDYEKVKEWRAKNKDKVNEQARRYRAKHPETNEKAKAKYRANNLAKIRENDRQSQAKRRRENPERQKIRYENWRARHEAKLWDKAGRPRAYQCEICNKKEITVFDHCHKTDLFRGWICDRCNKMLGLVKDCPILLRKLADYLEIFNDKINDEKKKCIA